MSEIVIVCFVTSFLATATLLAMTLTLPRRATTTLALVLFSCLLAGCETMQAIGSGELVGKQKASNYSYGLPDRYREGLRK